MRTDYYKRLTFKFAYQREVAALCFLNTEGEMDYHGFQATNELAFKWTEALY